MLVVRHRDRPGVLAKVLDAISAARINVQEMENVIFDGAEAAVARIHLEAAPSSAILDTLRASSPDILVLSLVTLGG
jgi:D-3-phosphoglycerate dehydrogenase